MLEYVPVKNEFKGFTEVSSTTARELYQHFGIRIDPEIRTFEYNGEPRFKRFSSLVSKVRGSDYLTIFIENPEFRGKHDYEQRAVFIKPNDVFVESHELAHSFIHSVKPDLVTSYTQGFNHPEKVKDSLALYALDEGAAQWAAINLGLKSADPNRIDEATQENNKLVADPNQADLAFDPIVLQRNIADIKQSAEDFYNDPVVKRGEIPGYIEEAYLTLLTKFSNYRKLMSLGYVYTASQLERLSRYDPELNVAQMLCMLIKNPPEFTQLEQVVTAFQGFSPLKKAS